MGARGTCGNMGAPGTSTRPTDSWSPTGPNTTFVFISACIVVVVRATFIFVLPVIFIIILTTIILIRPPFLIREFRHIIIAQIIVLVVILVRVAVEIEQHKMIAQPALVVFRDMIVLVHLQLFNGSTDFDTPFEEPA
jgi:hypothetical protein